MQPKLDKPVILLVEDDEDDAYFFGRTLRQASEDFLLHRLANGREAIDYLRSALQSNELPGIIFLDLKMPILSGFDVLEWMQNQTFPNPVQVIVLSGSEQQDDQDKVRKLGGAGYVVKPVHVHDLKRLLRGANSGGVAQSAAGTEGQL